MPVIPMRGFKFIAQNVEGVDYINLSTSNHFSKTSKFEKAVTFSIFCHSETTGAHLQYASVIRFRSIAPKSVGK